MVTLNIINNELIEEKINILYNLQHDINNIIKLVYIIINQHDIVEYKKILLEFIELLVNINNFELSYLFSELDVNNCYLEVYPGTGGKESEDWVKILIKMYMKWVNKFNFKISIINNITSKEMGFKSMIFYIEGCNAFGWLKTEQGTHRLIRKSPFNNLNKRHTSFASVRVYPKIKNNIYFDYKDLVINTYRSSGAGGQHVNTTNSAIRIMHLPTKITAQCQKSRSQHKNRKICLSILYSKIYNLKKKYQKTKEKKIVNENWGKQIRSYVLYPYKEIKDVRTKIQSFDTLKNLNGDIYGFIKLILIKFYIDGDDET